MDKSRRAFLRFSGGVAGTATIASLSGCSSLPGFGGGGNGSDGDSSNGESNSNDTDGSSDDGSTGSNDGSAGGGTPAYTQWLPAPAGLGTNHYQFVSVDPRTITTHESEFSQSTTIRDDIESLQSSLQPYEGVEFGDLSGMYLLGSSFVLVGSFDRQAFVDGIEQRGYGDDDTYGEYTVYTGGIGGSTIAVSDRRIVLTQGTGATDTIATVVETRRGERERYHQASEDCSVLVDTLGEGTLVSGQTHETRSYFEGAVGRGTAWTVEGAQSTLRGVVVFEEGVPVADVRERVETADFFADFENTSVRRQGRTAVVSGSIATGDLTRFELPWDQPAPEPPTVSFGFDYESDGSEGTLTITHEGGETVRTDRIYVRGSGFAAVDGVDMTAPGQWKGSASETIDGQPAVVAGDRVTVGVSTAYDIRLVWESSGGGQSATLAQDQGPDAR